MIRKHAWFGLALVVSGALVAACSSDDSSEGNGTGGGGTPATGAAPATGGETATGGTGSGTGGEGMGGMGTGGGPTINPPARGEDYDCSAATGAAPALKLTPIATGMNRPVFLTHAPKDSARLFVVEQDGRIQIIEDGTKVATPFLDITSMIERDPGYDERGLLGIAFHPNFAQNKLVYVYHTTGAYQKDGDDSGLKDVIAEYKVSDADPNVLDAGSRREVLVIDDPAKNHNGGTIEFGGDGFLYLAVGDGGGGNNEFGTAQNQDKLLGKVLRIDVDARDAGQYGIPAGNMTTIDGQPSKPEIWDYGLRNPYRWSFDGCTGDMYIGEVGQGTTEEIDVEPPGTGHRNYGWSITEGADCFNGNAAPTPDGCDKTGITFPVTTLATPVVSAIQGGYVYRGTKMPGLRGTYFYGGYTSGDIHSFVWDGTNATDVKKTGLSVAPDSLYGFGQDSEGEVYAVTSHGDDANTGTVYRIDPQ